MASKLLPSRLSLFLLLVLCGSIAAYALFKSVAAGVVALAAFLALVFKDVMPSEAGGKGLKNALKEVVVAFAAAVAAWVVLCVVLQTASPIDVVTSCSMVPVLERGDLIVLQGGTISVPTVKYSGALPQIKVHSSPCVISKGNESLRSFCASSLEVGGQVFSFNSSNDVVVYAAKPESYGLIVHRAWLRLENEEGKAVLVTKGDNNQFFDAQAGISLPSDEEVHGKMILRVPFVGFLKLFLFGQFAEPPGCDQRVTYS
ncbi:MAG: hypothetical protein ACP5O3_00650 [Candidatus Micrarchaeia archaeon]